MYPATYSPYSDDSIKKWESHLAAFANDVSEKGTNIPEHELGDLITRLPKIISIISFSNVAKGNLESILTNLYKLGNDSQPNPGSKEIVKKCIFIFETISKKDSKLLSVPTIAEDLEMEKILKNPNFNPEQHADIADKLAYRLFKSDNLAEKLSELTVRGKNYQTLFQYIYKENFAERKSVPSKLVIFLQLWEKIKKEDFRLLPKEINDFMSEPAYIKFDTLIEYPLYQLLICFYRPEHAEYNMSFFDKMLMSKTKEEYLILEISNEFSKYFKILMDPNRSKDRSKNNPKEHAQLILMTTLLEKAPAIIELYSQDRSKLTPEQHAQLIVTISEHWLVPDSIIEELRQKIVALPRDMNRYTWSKTPESTKKTFLECRRLLSTLPDAHYAVFSRFHFGIVDDRFYLANHQAA